MVVVVFVFACWPWCLFQWASAKACLCLLVHGRGFFLRFLFALVAAGALTDLSLLKIGNRGGGLLGSVLVVGWWWGVLLVGVSSSGLWERR